LYGVFVIAAYDVYPTLSWTAGFGHHSGSSPLLFRLASRGFSFSSIKQKFLCLSQALCSLFTLRTIPQPTYTYALPTSTHTQHRFLTLSGFIWLGSSHHTGDINNGRSERAYSSVISYILLLAASSLPPSSTATTITTVIAGLFCTVRFGILYYQRYINLHGAVWLLNRGRVGTSVEDESALCRRVDRAAGAWVWEDIRTGNEKRLHAMVTTRSLNGNSTTHSAFLPALFFISREGLVYRTRWSSLVDTVFGFGIWHLAFLDASVC